MSGSFNSGIGLRGISSGNQNNNNGLILWAQGLHNYTKLSNHGSVKGFKAETNGMALGIEATSIEDDVILGFSYAHNRSDVRGYGRDTDINSSSFVLYGEYKPYGEDYRDYRDNKLNTNHNPNNKETHNSILSNLFINGMLSYGLSSYEERKNVAGIILDADYDTNVIALQTLIGYKLYDKGYINITPTAGLRYVTINIDDYTDTAGQAISSDRIDTFTGIVGIKFDKDLKVSNTLTLKPEVKLNILHDLVNDKEVSTVTLLNGSSYIVTSTKTEKTLFEIGMGLGINLNNEWHLSLNYEGKFKSNYKDNTALLSVKYAF
jgi:outer membrane autotransporter protein